MSITREELESLLQDGFVPEGTVIDGLDLAGLSFQDVVFAGVQLRNIKVDGLDLARSVWTDCQWEEVSGEGWCLDEGHLVRCRLQAVALPGLRATGLSLTESSLTGAWTAADCCRSIWQQTTVEADLTGMNCEHGQFLEVDFQASTLVDWTATAVCFENVVIAQASFGGGSWERANLTGIDLAGRDLRGWQAPCATLFEADLSGATLAQAELRSARLYRASLAGADCTEAVLQASDGREADFSGAILDRADCSMASWAGAKLAGIQAAGANFAMAYLVGANLTEATCPSAEFSKADLAHSTVDAADLRGCGWVLTNVHRFSAQGTQWHGTDRSQERATDPERAAAEDASQAMQAERQNQITEEV